MTPVYADDLVAEARRAHGEGRLASPRRTAHSANPVCGDEVDLDLDDEGGRIVGIAQRTRGCVFTRGSASLLARTVQGLSVSAARDLADVLRRDLGSSAALPPGLAPLASVRVYPARLRCALLPWDALRIALGEA
ncbi:MAG TPA: iron-sulfur cluster assembly scaffold protein [Candidatus Limnocylindria bacterium]|nr:iron-sulfur cluster assembly scaffold protein [Candidatus Limnocylindria bacterium]